MECILNISKEIQTQFLLLSNEEKASVISHGAAIRFSDLNNRLFLAKSKISFFEKKYSKTLSELEESGLPDDADYEIHEDYIIWNHWTKVTQKLQKQIDSLRAIVNYGVYR